MDPSPVKRWFSDVALPFALVACLIALALCCGPCSDSHGTSVHDIAIDAACDAFDDMSVTTPAGMRQVDCSPEMFRPQNGDPQWLGDCRCSFIIEVPPERFKPVLEAARAADVRDASPAQVRAAAEAEADVMMKARLGK